jgi:hypothetical protein
MRRTDEARLAPKAQLPLDGPKGITTRQAGRFLRYNRTMVRIPVRLLARSNDQVLLSRSASHRQATRFRCLIPLGQSSARDLLDPSVPRFQEHAVPIVHKRWGTAVFHQPSALLRVRSARRIDPSLPLSITAETN